MSLNSAFNTFNMFIMVKTFEISRSKIFELKFEIPKLSFFVANTIS